jgi:multisubunit Na+/H+ antiporter MnhB subunit
MRPQDFQGQILNAASSLLGISLIIIAGLNVTHTSRTTLADEVAWVSAVLLALSCILSYLAVRAAPRETNTGKWADRVFMLGLVALFASIVVLAVNNR